MEMPLKNFAPRHPFLLCVDSDGCAFDVMEVKHKECFCPATVNGWGLQPVSRYAREIWEQVNLYSVTRGINRFLALERTLTLLGQRQEIQALTSFKMPAHDALAAWTTSGEPLNERSLQGHLESPQLRRTLAWSLDCNRRIAEMVHGVPPFPFVEESLRAAASHADVIIVSATSAQAVLREWQEHGLFGYVSAVCGQEAGSKEQCIRAAGRFYAPGHVLMLGDAPGDRRAAFSAGALFYPILPLHEADSWRAFYRVHLAQFLAEVYQAEAQSALQADFDDLLLRISG